MRLTAAHKCYAKEIGVKQRRALRLDIKRTHKVLTSHSFTASQVQAIGHVFPQSRVARFHQADLYGIEGICHELTGLFIETIFIANVAVFYRRSNL